MGRYRTKTARALPAAVCALVICVSCAIAASGTGTLTVSSTPGGALLSLDGTQLGTTPYTGTVASGDHVLLLALSGYNDYSATVTVPENGSMRGSYTLVAASRVSPLAATGVAATGALVVTSDPPGAAVTLDGTAAGTTPLNLTSVSEGDHTVTVSLAGYADQSATITVPAGGTSKNAYTLSPNILSVSSNPAGAAVTLDGTYAGTTPLSRTAVPAGAHTLVLTLDGYDPYTATVTVVPGRELKASYTLAAVTTTSATTAATTVTTEETTVSPGARPTPAAVTTLATTAAETNCTRHYAGTAAPGVSSSGRLFCTAVISATNGAVTLTIPGGTLVTAPGGKNATIRITPVSQLPAAAPSGRVFTGAAATFDPDGTTFDHPATVVFTLDAATWDRFAQGGLTIGTTGGSGWETLPSTPDPQAHTVSAPVRHFSTIGVFAPAPAAAAPSVKDAIRTVVAPANATTPLSPYIPAAAMPVAAVAAGAGLSIAGAFAYGSSFVSGIWEKLLKMFRSFATSETVAMANVTEVKKRSIAPSGEIAAALFCFSAREILVICLSIAGFVVAFLLQVRLSVVLSTFVIFVCAGGVATVLHELAHRVQAYRVGCRTEFQFWTLGAATMFVTAWLFGSAFAKPARTIIAAGEKELTPRESVSVKLAGPLMSLAVAVVSLALIPLGGFFAVFGAASFAMNLLTAVFALVPMKPNEGVEVWAYSRALWALLFVPMLVVYLWVYL